MSVARLEDPAPAFAEDIRLIIWDLDDTFWDGTLTEGGIRYRIENERLVRLLGTRGIMSAICSKNVHACVEDVLRSKGIWDRFIFPSIDWTAKGPRIAAMLKQIGLRAPSVLFIDDNPLNRAQAVQMCPGLNVAAPDVIPWLADAAQLKGAPDPDLDRLARYKLMERKAVAAASSSGSAEDFLRQAGIRVFLDYDIEANLDRAVELVNRTNQLNFTKKRLPEDPVAARGQLAAELAHNTADAALIRVRDRYGDYGYVGFYLSRRVNGSRRLEHFCFSCRILGMFVETWAYRFLGEPALEPVGEVLSDPRDRGVVMDWITPASIDALDITTPETSLRYDHIFARGGCDLASLMHFFALHGGTITEEFNGPRNGQMLRRDHSAFLMPALGGGLSEDQGRAAAELGYGQADFETALTGSRGGRSLVLLSFWADVDIPLYRHRETDLRLPYWLVGAQHHDLIARTDLRKSLPVNRDQRRRLQTLSEGFLYEGILSPAEMRRRYALVLDHIPPETDIVIMLANERGPACFADPRAPRHPRHVALNRVLREVATGRQGVILIDPNDHISGLDDLIDLNHFKRPVYHAMYRDAVTRLAALGEPRKADTVDG